MSSCAKNIEFMMGVPWVEFSFFMDYHTLKELRFPALLDGATGAHLTRKNRVQPKADKSE